MNLLIICEHATYIQPLSARELEDGFEFTYNKEHCY